MAANTGFFKGKTVLISGASRGIGLAICKKLARDEANIAVLAKSIKNNPKIPGTIYSAAEEIEKAGGHCLPVQCDIRDELSVIDAVKKTVKKFGGIDILINNASVVLPFMTLDTDMKTYDLIQNTNVRGSFLLPKMCIPHLKEGNNPHILTMSPPLLMDSFWLAPQLAYTISKFSMSMCVLGFSEELRTSKIAVNALWPKTFIWTAGVEAAGFGPEVRSGCRKPEIVADAAYVMLSKPSSEYTRNFVYDEDVLSATGVKNFDQYAMDPKEKLIIDGFVPGGHHLNPEYDKTRA